MMNRAPRMQRATRPVGHQQQSRLGSAGRGISGMSGQRVNLVAGAGPRSQKYRPAVNQVGAAQQPSANAENSSAGVAAPVSKTLFLSITEVIFNTCPSSPYFVRLLCLMPDGVIRLRVKICSIHQS